jgi:hypothetical protein
MSAGELGSTGRTLGAVALGIMLLFAVVIGDAFEPAEEPLPASISQEVAR